MGLDIVVYESVEKADFDFDPDTQDDALWEIADERGLVHAFVLEGFQHSLRGLEEGGWYKTDGEVVSFRAGSYSGYNYFRAELCRVVLGVDPKVVWADPDKYRNEPFFELIHFADNEGTIGPEAAADLHEDFVAHREKIVAVWGGDGSVKPSADGGWEYNPLIATYDNFENAFRLARNGGMVVFC